MSSTRRPGYQRSDFLATRPGPLAVASLLLTAHLGCSSGNSNPPGGNNGATGSSSSSGTTGSSGGAMEPGGASGGSGSGSGGASTGASSSGGNGSSSGGSGASTSGSSTGGSSTGGSSSSGGSGSGSGGSSSGGTGGREAGAGSSGEAGAGSSGGGGDGGGGAGCAGTTYKLCEDFETGTAGALPTGWTTYKGYGAGSPMNVTLDTAQSHSGKMSLKSNDLGSSGATRAQRSLATLGATASKHWGRVFYKVQSPAPKPTGGVWHNTWGSLFGSAGEDRIVDTVENTGGMHQWLYNLPSDACSKGSAYSWGYDTAWHCAEWYVDVSTNAFRFFTDSTEVTSIGFTGQTCSMMSNPYTEVILGSTSYQAPTAPWVMWFDDLAINDTQIGCQ